VPIAGVGGKGGAEMVASLLEAPSEGYHDCTPVCAQAYYDRAAWDYLNWEVSIG